jgi:hypothetical protein
MRKYIGLVAGAAALVISLSVGIATATAGGGNSANAHACQQGGWQQLVRADQTPFNNQDECVSYGAHGGTLTAAATDHAYCAPAGTPTFGQCSIPGVLDFDFDASSGPLGQTPTGSFVFESLPNHVEANVTCLQVSGNVASVGGIITKSTFPAGPLGSGVSFTVKDNGPGTPGFVSELTFSPLVPGTDTPACGSLFLDIPFGLAGPPTGDIVVKDG